MPGKITDYVPLATLTDGDLSDWSNFDEISAYDSRSVTWAALKTNIESQITFTNLYTANGTLSGFREVEMGINDMVFKTTGDANLLRFDSTSDRIGIGTATPTAKLDVVGDGKFELTAGQSVDITNGTNPRVSLKLSTLSDYGAIRLSDTTNVDRVILRAEPSLISEFLCAGITNRLIYKLDNSAGVERGQMAVSGSDYGQLTLRNTSNIQTIILRATGDVSFDTGGNFGIGTATPTQKLDVAGGVNVNANVNNQLFVSNLASFVGVRTATALGNESFRVVGEMNAGGVGVGNVINPASNRFTANTGGSLKFGSQVIKDDSNSWYFESSTNTFKFRNNLNAYSLLQLTPSNALFESKDSSVGTTLEDETIGISSSYYNGSVNLSVANIKNTAIDVAGAYKLGFEVGGSERLAINNDGTIEVDGNNAVASFSGAVTNITIVNGIVTAVS